MYYRGAHCAVIVFDVTTKVLFISLKHFQESFENAKNLVKEAKANEFLTEAHIVLVGNKVDVDSLSDDHDQSVSRKREVTYQEANNFAQNEQIEYYEVSARKSIGVHQLFEEIAKKMLSLHGKYIKR